MLKSLSLNKIYTNYEKKIPAAIKKFKKSRKIKLAKEWIKNLKKKKTKQPFDSTESGLNIAIEWLINEILQYV